MSPARLSCWLRGHRWRPWAAGTWTNVWGTVYKVRWCDQCRAMDRKVIG